jgi:glycine/sarcosine N-methyltransferase
MDRPAMQPPAFFGEGQEQRIVHQVWDWDRAASYVVHLYITTVTGDGWRTLHFSSRYHALRREEVSAALRAAGFGSVDWLMPEQSGYYQPVVMARIGPQR